MAERELDLSSKPDAATLEAWQALARKALGLAPGEPLVSLTSDGIALPLLGTRADWPIADASGVPGALPFTRGTQGEATGRWDVRTICAEPDPTKANAEILEDLANGATSICLRVDGQTNPTKADFARALKDVWPGIPIALDAGLSGVALAAVLLEAIGDARNAALFVNHDAFALAARYGHTPMLKESAALAVQFAASSPSCRAIGVDTRPYHNAGATRAQELGIALASAIAHLRTLTDAGLDVAAAVHQIAFLLVTDADFVSSITKMRTFRRLWARVLDACGASSAMGDMHITAATSYLMMTRRDAHTNILRTTAATFAAALGGADAITVQPFTAPSGVPSAEARRIARNTQSILMEEAGLARVMDPAGGAFGFERLTEDLAAKAWSAFQEIEKRGGMAQALGGGFIAAQLAEAWEIRRKRIAGRLDLVTGVSDFPVLSEPTPSPVGHLQFVPARAFAPLPVHHLDEDFEALRESSDRHLVATGERPKVYLVRIGNELDCAERTAFARALFEAGGIETVAGPLDANPETAAEAFLDSGVRVAALVSSDAQYAEKALAFAHEVKRAGARYLYFVGPPRDLEAPLFDAGVDAFVDEGIDAIEMLQRLHLLLGLAE